MAILTFGKWTALQGGRTALSRTLGKYGSQVVDKPVATMTV